MKIDVNKVEAEIIPHSGLVMIYFKNEFRRIGVCLAPLLLETNIDSRGIELILACLVVLE